VHWALFILVSRGDYQYFGLCLPEFALCEQIEDALHTKLVVGMFRVEISELVIDFQEPVPLVGSHVLLASAPDGLAGFLNLLSKQSVMLGEPLSFRLKVVSCCAVPCHACADPYGPLDMPHLFDVVERNGIEGLGERQALVGYREQFLSNAMDLPEPDPYHQARRQQGQAQESGEFGPNPRVA